MVIAARDRGLPPKQARQVVAGHRQRVPRSIREFAKVTNLDLWYMRIAGNDLRERFRQELGSRGERGLDAALSRR